MPTNDLFKSVLYNDGEGATQGDQNDGQRFLASRLTDQIFEKLIGKFDGVDPDSVGLTGANTSTAWAFCLDVTGAMPKQGSANNKVKISAGTIFQKIGNATGNEPTLLPYTFDGTLELTLSNGHATLNRVDMIQMKLDFVEDDPQSRDFQDATTHVVTTSSMNKKRQVEATVSIKSGTPAANPVYPTPDAGYVPLCCVIVDATYNGGVPLTYNDLNMGSAAATLHDLRMPINVMPHHLTPSRDGVFPTAQWTGNTIPTFAGSVSNGATTGSAPDNELWIYQPARKGRLLGISLATSDAASSASGKAWLNFVSSIGTGPAVNYNRLVDISSFLNTGTVPNGNGPKIAKMSDIEVLAPISAPSTANSVGGTIAYTVTGNGTHNPPLWANGERAYYEQHTVNGNSFTGSWLKRMAISFKAQALVVYGAITYIAEGI